ncbi:sensor domain-containing diguanylate cyclase [Vibrio palustris]|uniref:diguanylate cyclase n=1 Tax=Vibrio palustris TaxID=1918946 RepID=A0A1R4B378_9VIBR|nr:sensor domain-containing diguanylate cyclase [Vibrio palustris]SJL83372.1 putative diguanylate cyclase YdaM [Vibrio palustris]
MVKERVYWKFIGYFVVFGVSVLSFSLYLLDNFFDQLQQQSIAESTEFQQRRADSTLDYFTQSALRSIDNVNSNQWLLQDTADSVEHVTPKLERWMFGVISASKANYRIEYYDTNGRVQEAMYVDKRNRLVLDTESKGIKRITPNEWPMSTSTPHLAQLSSIRHSSYYRLDDQPDIPLVLGVVPIYNDKTLSGYIGLFVNMTLPLKVLTTNAQLDLFLVASNGDIIASSHTPASQADNQPYPFTLQHTFNIVDINASKELQEHQLTRYKLRMIRSRDSISLYSRPNDHFLNAKAEERSAYLAKMISLVLVFSILFGSFLAVKPSRMISRLKRVSKERDQYLKIMDQSVPVLKTDLTGNITEVNSAFSLLSGYYDRELIGKTADVLSFNPEEVNHDEMWEVLQAGLSWQGEFHNISKSGHEFWLFSTILPIYEYGKLSGYMAVSSDKTEKKQIELMAEMDSLTKIYNRAKIDKCLAQEQERARRYGSKFSVIMLDVDFFKSVNDTYGHLVGDKVLYQLAIMLNTNTRTVDEVGRWGGEEFMIVCPETALNEAEHVAEKLRQAVESYDFPDVGTITVSLGIAMYTGNEDLKRVLAEADAYLYEAKRLGRNRIASRLSNIVPLNKTMRF